MTLVLYRVLVVACTMGVLAQSDCGTITGTMVDLAGAMVANAAIEARNSETGALHAVASSAAGNYTLAELPAGTYELTVTVPGFKKYVRPGLIVAAAQTCSLNATNAADVPNGTDRAASVVLSMR